MDDTISRAAAIEYLMTNMGWRDEAGYKVITDLFNGIPAVDAVPVVRCRDCKYYAINRLTKAYEPDKRFNPSVCIIGEFARPRKPDWYCADGERRESE